MKNKIFFIACLIFLGLGAYLRINGLVDRAPFDWDQTRDYKVVHEIVSGRLTLLGPVAKGDGGFHLAPLYYYLLVPGYLIFHASPIALPVTSVAIDLISIFILIWLFHKAWGRRVTFLTVAFWSVSWLMVDSSRVSWNVALLPAWSLFSLYYSSSRDKFSSLYLGFIAGLAWHIHASLIPLGGILLLYHLASKKLLLKNIALSIAGYLLAISPLIIFDVRHYLFNFHSMQAYFHYQSQIAKPPLMIVVGDVLSKYSFIITSLFLGNGYRLISLGASLILVPIWGLFSRSKTAKVSAFSILIILFLNIYLRDLGFPEYYLLGVFVPFLYLISQILTRIKFNKYLSIFALVVVAFFSLNAYKEESTTYGLGVKVRTADAVSLLSDQIDLRSEFSFRREGGIQELINISGTSITSEAPLKVLITDELEGPRYINGELTTQFFQERGIRALYYNEVR